MRFKTDCVSLVGSKFTVFALFYQEPITWAPGFTLYLRAIFQVQAPGGGAYIWRGNLTEGFLRYRLGGLIFGGAYTWRGLFSEFYGTLIEAQELSLHSKIQVCCVRGRTRRTRGLLITCWPP